MSIWKRFIVMVLMGMIAVSGIIPMQSDTEVYAAEPVMTLEKAGETVREAMKERKS